MSNRSTGHASFAIEHVYAVPPAEAFAAWATIEAKSRWWGPPDDTNVTHALDFRVGGSESARMHNHAGARWTYDAHYYDIVENERIVFCYQMTKNDELASVSVTTVEFVPEGPGTKLTLTEYDVFLDGIDTVADRKTGTGHLLEGLGRLLEEQRLTTG